MGFVTYENRRNPHVTIHVEGCSHIRKNGGEHAHGQGDYHNHATFPDAQRYAQRTELPLIECSFCRPADHRRSRYDASDDCPGLRGPPAWVVPRGRPGVDVPQPLSVLREKRWASVPSSPGVYWWYFPQTDLDRLRIADLCQLADLRLRHAPDGKVCLYHGMAKNLAKRVEWHADQDLRLSYLRSGFLSTLRFTLLALNDFDYLSGSERINCFFDTLSVSWQVADSREQAVAIEGAEFQSTYHYPLNIRGNRRPELVEFIRYVIATRRAYKRRYLTLDVPPNRAGGGLRLEPPPR